MNNSGTNGIRGNGTTPHLQVSGEDFVTRCDFKSFFGDESIWIGGFVAIHHLFLKKKYRYTKILDGMQRDS